MSSRNKKRKYRVRFYCNIDHDHKAHASQCMEKGEVTFTDRSAAVEFWQECTMPITPLSELVGNKAKVNRHNKKKPFEKPINY